MSKEKSYISALAQLQDENTSLIDELDRIKSETMYLEATLNKWIDIKSNPECLNNVDMLRTIIEFDNGEVLFYSNDNWPFAQAIRVFELPVFTNTLTTLNKPKCVRN